MTNKKGFTLIELLVVIAIIALLSTLAVVALGSARQKSRDAKRLSDVKQIQTALELYFTYQNGYPTAATAVTLGDATHKCLGANGFHASTAEDACTAPIYMGLVPANPTPNGTAYSYTGSASTYAITFTLEGASGGFAQGLVTASPSGMTQ
jgi:general secretion pathway protein G